MFKEKQIKVRTVEDELGDLSAFGYILVVKAYLKKKKKHLWSMLKPMTWQNFGFTRILK